MHDPEEKPHIMDEALHESRRVAVVGAGRWGINHVNTLHALGCLGGIVESNDDVTRRLKTRYPDVKFYSRLEDALKDDFDGFTVATPAETHYAIAESILKSKRHLLVEKPIALNVEEAIKLKELAENNSVNLMVGHLLLFHPAIRKIKELIDSGKIGRLQYVYSNRLNLGTVRTEENILWSFAPHDIAIFQYFIGMQPKEVESRGGIFLQPNIHDSSMTVLTYPNNVVGHIFVSWLHPFKEHRIVVIGSKGMFSYEDSSEDKQILFYEKGIDWVKGEPIKRDGPTEIIPYDRRMPLEEELKYFVSRLNGRSIEIADAQSAIEVLEILQKASDSLLNANSGRTKDARQPVRNGPQAHSFVHPTGEIDANAVIGKDTNIWHYSRVLSGCKIGERCNIGQNVVIGPNVTIGDGCKIQNNVSVYKGVTLEEDVFCGPSMVFTNVYNPRAAIRRMDEIRPTLVKKGATIGANATIVCGVTIGRYALVGAGAVVTEDLKDHSVVVGNPARQIGWICECGNRLDDQYKCTTCGCSYAHLEH
jgi:UDP-2-acetamido-3-amino-2,3-dideoxy-glucuronate N-acetyltransferase